MKEETVVYIRVPASDPPKEYNKYHVELLSGAQTTAYYKKDWIVPFDTIITGSVKYWLRPVPLSSLLQEGAVELEAWMSENCFVTECHKYKHSKDMKTRSLSEIIKLFIEEKYGK